MCHYCIVYTFENGDFALIVCDKFQASCIDSTAEPDAVFKAEVQKLTVDKLKPQEQITLEPYERDHAVVIGVYRPTPADKNAI